MGKFDYLNFKQTNNLKLIENPSRFKGLDRWDFLKKSPKLRPSDQSGQKKIPKETIIEG